MLSQNGSPNRCGRLISPPQSIAAQLEIECPSRVTFGELSDKVLLNIFRHYLDASPRSWPRLVHICHRWRCLVLASQLTLHLRLFCTHGVPFLKIPDYLPSLPIVVEYGGSLEFDPPAPDDEDNIVAALKQSDRVSSISLTVTSSLLEKLSTIEGPFSELENLVLLSRNRQRRTLPGVFGRSTRLRSLHLTGITFFALPLLLYSSKDLVDLQLHEVLNTWLFSLGALTDALSKMSQLRSLSLHFPFTNHEIDVSPPSMKRVIFPALTRLDFRGIDEYLEGFVSGIDAPRLVDIEVAFTSKNHELELIELSGFINRIEMPKSHRQAQILCSGHGVCISLMQPGAPTYLTLLLICDRLLSMARICAHFSSFLSNVECLRVSATQQPRQDDSGQWLEIIRPFTGVKWVHLDGDYSTNVVGAFQPALECETVLPALHKLYIIQSGPCRTPLREVIVSFMTSRSLSGHPIAVEYEPLYYVSKQRGPGPLSQQATIEVLHDDILFDIFRHCLDPTPQIWPTLAWVCQRWRQIVFSSPLGLNLRLYCTYGTRVLKALNYWPALPIVVKYGGTLNLDPPAPEDDENIIAALKQSDRVSSINLTVTSSLLEKLSAVSEPLLELEELHLLSRDNMRLALPGAFRWGPRLRTLHSTRITFPSLPQLLSLSHDLVDIQLHEIPSAGYFSPEAFANSLSGMINLRTLSLHFLSLPPRRNHLSLPPQSGERVVLPALTSLKYRGTSKYLDSLVAIIDAPILGDIDITLFSQPTMDASQLGRFVERTGIQTPLSRAEVQTSGDAISISFTSSETSTPLRLHIPCKQLDWQLSSMAQVCDRFSPFLFRIETLGINTAQSPSGQDDLDDEQWLELVRPFDGATDFRVVGVHATNILYALRTASGGRPSDTTVLTALRNLHVQEPVALDWRFRVAAKLFITSRRRSGRLVNLELLCSTCNDSSRDQQSLKRHLVDKHAYRLMCSYCGDFECTPKRRHIFQKHLKSKHPEVARNDADISNTSSGRSDPDFLVYWHGSPCAPVSHHPPR